MLKQQGLNLCSEEEYNFILLIIFRLQPLTVCDIETVILKRLQPLTVCDIETVGIISYKQVINGLNEF
jgi:hypothetical protein